MLLRTESEKTAHLRSKCRFYVAGWTANTMGDIPQALPESCKGNADVEKHHEEYLKGYGDCYANNESEPPVEDYN